MKKLLISLAGSLVLQVLVDHASKQRDLPDRSTAHYDRWIAIVEFLKEMQRKGLPL